ncbi:TRAP transporter small permease [Pseudothioclava nitratireducens]|jgi:TRAP-type C4-dicarboxylate transport system permease small subunit|uniref:TRAP transporter small permease n=1 Tax=Pseudothioclava nitratireducens TaxID=1928646 RepID=UPI0023DA5391|nr:TRAP transporter small permease subunit [Defluviimonas nitratireducens]MDF1619565.1 TRAP transporter small permease subunit [Defluviimonas nitratireducens]
MERLAHIYGRGVNVVAAGMLAAIFITFLIQIAARYVLTHFGWKLELGWTIELNLTLWLWLVLFTCAFVLRERDHVKFDLIYSHVSPAKKRVFAVLAASSIVVALVAAMPDTWDYVSFYKIKKSPTLRIRLNYVFVIYLVFAAVLILRYGWRIVDVLRGRDLSRDERDILAD